MEGITVSSRENKATWCFTWLTCYDQICHACIADNCVIVIY